jgi:hypothetical protein
LVTSVKEFRAVFIKQEKFKEIVLSAERGGSVDVDYKALTIRSANPEWGEYNFFNSVTGGEEDGWFGYRVLGFCNFGKYCGATNMVNIGTATTEYEVVASVEQENQAAGFGDIAEVYQPESLIEFYNYKFPDPAALPPGLLKIPFVARNGEEDETLDYDQPPWLKTYMGPPSRVVDELSGSVIQQGNPRAPRPARPVGTEAPEEDDEAPTPRRRPQRNPNMRLLKSEKRELRRVGLFGGKVRLPLNYEDEWHKVLDAIKDKRGGCYPPDWDAFWERETNGLGEGDDDDDDDDDSGPSIGGLLSPARSIRARDDDTQSSGLGGSPPKGGSPGSTPLGDRTLSQNSESGPSPGRPVKRRRAGNRFVATEADDEDGDDEQVRYLSSHARPNLQTHALKEGQCSFPFIHTSY